MRKIRVFQNVENKRIVSGTVIRYLGTILLFLFLLPYIITALFHNVEGDAQESYGLLTKSNFSENIFVNNMTAAGCEKIPLEVYLVDKLSRSISKEYEPEAIKAQAVLLRTAVIEQLWESGEYTAGSIRGTLPMQDEEYGGAEIADVFGEAVYSTMGVYLTYQGRPAKAPYFAVSSGRTRSGVEVLESENYRYLEAVTCGRDFLAENFNKKVTMGKNDFIQAWEKAAETSLQTDFDITKMKISRDASDYIIGISYEESELSGEECRIIWGLDSSCFYLEEENQKIHFTVKGVGHGLGMSQFAANEMAKEESDYVEILEYFFHDTQLTKIE